MDPQERNIAYLWDMREAAQLISDFLKGATYSHFITDKMMQSAIERQLEIIGEAARRITPEYQQAHPEIPWHGIIGLRNILTHEYGEVKLDRVWLVASTSIPELLTILDALIPPIDSVII
jgi:uncharacterized protein with HEPN domain